ncbi:MAG TPA: hypothetical protein VF323_04455, partial [Candidatus Limnocylindrales bacterium]
RLVAAADTANAAGANVEALRHLRAALELATPDRHLDLYESMADTTVHGDTSIEFLTTALGLARASGEPRERIIRIIAKILTFHTRWQGSVAGRPSEAELMELVNEGRAGLHAVTDETVRAHFLLVEAFLPFWIRVGGRAPSDEELGRGDGNGRAAVEVAQRLGDAALASAALDGIGTIAQMRGDFEGMRSTAQQRLDMGERLSVAERIDAACMVAWACLLLGDLDRGDAVAGSALAVVQPGQAGNWALHLAAWRALIATLRGDWDVAIAAANKAHGFWLELGQVPAGYAIRGFLAALSVAQARGDDSGAAHWREVVGQIASAFQGTQGRRLQGAIGANDAATVVEALEGLETTTIGDDTLERALGFVSDRAIPIDPGALQRIDDLTFPTARLAHAQIDRARGLANGDPGPLRRALDMFATAGARPDEARVRVELGRLTGDEGMTEEGLRMLREIGDVAQLDRFA